MPLKVRRAAAKVLSSLIVSRPDRLSELLPLLLPTLIGRFREREENVKMDVFATFNDLLGQVAHASKVAAVDSGGAMSPAGVSALLFAEVPKVVKAAARQLKEKVQTRSNHQPHSPKLYIRGILSTHWCPAQSTKTRVAAFQCLRQLVTTIPGCLGAEVQT